MVKERVDWDTYFIGIARAVSIRSTCLRRNYGAAITKNNKIVSTGYNGSPRRIANCIDIGTCTREKNNIPKGSNYELCEAVHAEQNAMLQGIPSEMEDATIYIFGTESNGSIADSRPCLLCNRMLKNVGIKRVVCYNDQQILCSYFI